MDCRSSLNIVLVEPEIPGNTGSIGRLCVGLQANLILVEPLGFVIDDKHLKRAGLDYWPHLDYCRASSLDSVMDQSPRDSRFFFFSKKAPRPYTEPRYRKGDFLVFGKETRGFSEAIHQRFSHLMWRIPLFGPIRSLNLAVSVGVVAYEAMRQICKGFQS